jgi:peptide/nickel transport system substrate-binding protein
MDARRLRTVVRLTAPVALAGLLAWTDSGAPTVGDSRPELAVGVAGDVTGVYPKVLNESFTFAVLGNAYEALTRFDRDLRTRPALAARWESADDLTWRFRIHPGLRFSDGRRVTVADVAASVRLAQREDATRHALADVAAVEVVSEDEVRITTHGPAPTLLTLLHHALIVPASDIESPPAAASGWPAGTGPYAVESWTRGKELVLRANEHWRGGRAPFARIRLLVMPSGPDRALALRQGRIQVADSLGLDEWQWLQGSGGVRVLSRPALRVLYLGLRVDSPPFADPAVREAFDLAIDREELVARALGGHGTPAAQMVPPAVRGYNPELAASRPDRARARALLAKASAAARKVTLRGPNNRYVNDERILREVARQLAEVGVTVTVEARDKETFFNSLGTPETRFYLSGWSCDGADAGNALGSLFHTPKPSGLGHSNAQGFSDPVLDAIIDAADRAPTLAERNARLAAGLARVASLHLALPLVVQHETIGVSRALDWDPPLDMALRLEDARPVLRDADGGPDRP